MRLRRQPEVRTKKRRNRVRKAKAETQGIESSLQPIGDIRKFSAKNFLGDFHQFS
jgi:hypothetical protein